MPLPDASLLLTWPADRWRALGLRLAAIALLGAHEDIARIGGTEAFEPAVRPLRQWYLRRGRGPAFAAMRMLMYDDPVTEAEAREALGDIEPGDLTTIGLLRRTADGLFVSPFVLRFVDDLFLIGDDLLPGGDAVMSLGRLTVDLARAAMPARRASRALDLGCGAGTCALLLARQAEHVVGTDINPRAVLLSRVNQALNGIVNVDFRCGDLYAPVAGESFDVIASQPPFVARPEGRDETTYLFGGRRGDELPLRALAEAPDRLRPGGRAVMLVQWPIVDDEPIASRVRRALDDARRNAHGDQAVDVLVVDAPALPIDNTCMADAALDHASFGPDYAREVIRYREHMDRLGVRELRETLTVLSRRPEAVTRAFTASFTAPALDTLKLHGHQLDGLLAANALVAGGDGALLSARLTLPEGARAEEGDGAFRLLFPEGHVIDGTELDARGYAIVSAIASSPSVAEAARRFAAQQRVPVDGAVREIVRAAERLLTTGVLVIG